MRSVLTLTTEDLDVIHTALSIVSRPSGPAPFVYQKSKFTQLLTRWVIMMEETETSTVDITTDDPECEREVDNEGHDL